jgi:hypothetical protein
LTYSDLYRKKGAFIFNLSTKCHYNRNNPRMR